MYSLKPKNVFENFANASASISVKKTQFEHTFSMVEKKDTTKRGKLSKCAVEKNMYAILQI